MSRVALAEPHPEGCTCDLDSCDARHRARRDDELEAHRGGLAYVPELDDEHDPDCDCRDCEDARAALPPLKTCPICGDEVERLDPLTNICRGCVRRFWGIGFDSAVDSVPRPRRPIPDGYGGYRY